MGHGLTPRDEATNKNSPQIAQSKQIKNLC